MTTTSFALADYVKIARPDHWFKNIFMVPGIVLAIALGGDLHWSLVATIPLGILAVCLIASANYTINEWLDRDFDSHHPLKKSRPAVANKIRGDLVYSQWFVLSLAGLGISWLIGPKFFAANSALLFMGLVYNVPPIRTKDRKYLDVLSEAINNPLRFLLGWYLLDPPLLPPASIVIAYWMGGAFLMGVKRYAEYRFINDPERAGRYRRSFQFYTEESLLLSSLLYAILSAVLIGVFLVKYKIEFILSVPLFSVLFVWYLHIGMQPASISQTPEKLYKNKAFVAFVGFVFVAVIVMFFVRLPWLDFLVHGGIPGVSGR